MDKKNLLIASGLICITIILVIGVFIIISTIADTSTVVSNSTTDNTNNSTNGPDKEYLTFDNSTPEAAAKSVARLYQGVSGFYTCHEINASLTSDGNYWIVNIDNTIVVTVDAKTLMSKQKGDLNQSQNTWKSLDELKAKYIAEIQSASLSEDAKVGESHKVIMNSKEIWKVLVNYHNDKNQKQIEYVYVDLATGKSKNTWDRFNEGAGVDSWLTLKELDDKSGLWPHPFKNALRDLYPE